MSENTIYLDHNATTPLHPEVKKTLIEAMELFGNPSSLHSYGRKSAGKVEEARKTIAEFIGASADELIFTGSGSEANNTVLSSFNCSGKSCSCHVGIKKQNIITTAIEHPCVLETAKCMSHSDMDVTFLKVDEHGRIDIKELESSITDTTVMISVMMANNEIGVLQDIKAITELAHSKGVLVHTDAVQAVGKIPVDVKELGVDFLTFSAHKIYGPKGIGGLYVKKGTSFCPLIRGGHQEKGRRAGTENTLGILGFAKAIEMRKIEMDDELKRLTALKEKLRQGFIDTIPDIRINGDVPESMPNTLNVSFMGAEGEAILLYMDLDGIAVSTGSACASGSLDPSHVLLATGLDAEYAHGSIRFSMGRETTEEEIKKVLEKVPPIIARIRSMSTVYASRKQ